MSKLIINHYRMNFKKRDTGNYIEKPFVNKFENQIRFP